jgi:inward rectifier potassium channel
MTRQINRGRARIVRPDGRPNVERQGSGHPLMDLYHTALDTTWTRFLVGAIVVFIGANLLFATVYVLIGVENIGGARTSALWPSMQDAFAFSMQTLTTVGYGILHPASPAVNLLSGIEAMLGLLLFGVFTGLAFGRFSRLKPRIHFSRHAVVAPYRDGLNAVMIRLANERSGPIMDARVTMILVMEYEEDNQLKRRFFDLSLEINTIRSLAMSWTVVHPLTEDSPMLRLRKTDLERVNAELIVILHAFDDVVGQQFYARTSYTHGDFLIGHRFLPMFHNSPKGHVVLDLKKIDLTQEASLAPLPDEVSAL